MYRKVTLVHLIVIPLFYAALAYVIVFHLEVYWLKVLSITSGAALLGMYRLFVRDWERELNYWKQRARFLERQHHSDPYYYLPKYPTPEEVTRN